MHGKPLPSPSFPLKDPGLDAPVDYSVFGEFKDAGSAHYQFVIKNLEGLKKAVGAGIYPNQSALKYDPGFAHLQPALGNGDDCAGRGENYQ